MADTELLRGLGQVALVAGQGLRKQFFIQGFTGFLGGVPRSSGDSILNSRPLSSSIK
jgi:hypothetical protein